MYRFHWILLVIEINRCRITVFDSLRKPKSLYQDFIDLINKAWARFVRAQVGISQTDEIAIRTDFPVCLQFDRFFSFFCQHQEYYVTYDTYI